MLPAATVRALTIPAFTAAEFTPRQWDSAEDKARFANALMKFIAHEFPRQSFTKPFYRRLSNTFGHIAHQNLDGFYAVFFERDADKVVFLEQTLSWPHFGDPTFTFSDVERAVKRRLRSAKVIDIFRLLEADATRRRELATLATGEIRSADPATRSDAHWLAAVFARPRRTIGLPRDPGRTGQESRRYR
jgi:hypothetical protein